MKKTLLNLIFGEKGEERKVGGIAVAIQVLLMLAAGAAVYFSLFPQISAHLENDLTEILNDQQRVILGAINSKAATMRANSTQPGLRKLMRAAVAGTAGKDDLDKIGDILENIALSQNMSSIELSDAQGKIISANGDFLREPVVATALRNPANATLLWKGQYYLQVATPIWENDAIIGRLRMEVPLPEMTRALQDYRKLGASGEIVLCAPQPQARITCFPSRHRPNGFEVQNHIDGQPLPMSYALAGKKGVIITLDYRRQEVIDAYQPVGDSGLGIVAKIDRSELLNPIQKHLLWASPLLAMLAALGAILLRWQVVPLVREVMRSRSRVQAILDNTADGLITVDEHGIVESFNVSAARIFGHPAFEVIGKNVNILMPEPYRSKHDEGIQNYLRTGVAKIIGQGAREVQGRRKNGSVFPLTLTLGEMVLDGRRHFIASVRDISALKLAEGRVRKLSLVAEATGNSVIIADRNGIIEYVNPAFTRVSGYTFDEAIGQTPRLLESGQTSLEYYQNLWKTLLTGGEWRGELLNRKKNGELFWEYEVISAVRNEEGEITHFVAVKEDITERKQAEKERFRLLAILDQSLNEIYVFDSRTLLFSYVNSSALHNLGYSLEEMQRKTPLDFTPEFSTESFHAMIESLRRGEKEKILFETDLLRANGNRYPAEVHLQLVESGSAFLAIINDITERKRYESQLEYQANYDTLTQLPNRNLFQDRLNQALAYAHRHGGGLAVLFIDLDNFKNINDSLGHDVGDTLLQRVAARIADCVRGEDTVSRLGGDEFVAILADITAENDIAPVSRKILGAVAEPIIIDGHELFTTCSIGIALYPKDGKDTQALLKSADSALYRAKEQGRNNAQFYTTEMNIKAMERLQLEKNLRHALERNEFLLHYQPRVDLRSGEITGMEALVRWQHPELGLVPPANFIPLAEESGLIVPLGEWVLRTACAQNKTWQIAGLAPVCVAVNLSARQFRQQNLLTLVEQVLQQTGLDPSYLELEMTESLIMQNIEATIAILTQLKATGVKFSIDDFGTGYSSLAYLKRFPIDMLKIDQSFVRDITTDPDDAAIATTIISMAHDMGLKVIAEGVETNAQKSFLRLRHCDEMQGYFFSKPVPTDEFEILLREKRCLQMAGTLAASSQRTLLLLDDEENILTSLVRLLRRDGYQILKTTSAAAAFELLAEHPVGVIISDQRMPEMSGIEFLRRVKDIYPNTVRMVLSGYTDLKSVTDAINEGAVYKFLTKPWDDEMLRATIQESFRHYELAQDNQRLNAEMIEVNDELKRTKLELEARMEQKSSEAEQNAGMLHISQDMLENLPLGVIGIGEDGLIAFANRAANDLFYEKGPLVGSVAAERLPGAIMESPASERRSCRLDNGTQVVFWNQSIATTTESKGRIFVVVPEEGG
ncbi:MAG: EAL domain-containing protein [Burkholderiales bacterium]